MNSIIEKQYKYLGLLFKARICFFLTQRYIKIMTIT